MRPILIHSHAKALDANIIPDRPRAYWSYARRILKLKKSSGHVMDLKCARSHVILGVTLGTTSQKILAERAFSDMEENINTTSKTAGKYLQESYGAVICAI